MGTSNAAQQFHLRIFFPLDNAGTPSLLSARWKKFQFETSETRAFPENADRTGAAAGRVSPAKTGMGKPGWENRDGKSRSLHFAGDALRHGAGRDDGQEEIAPDERRPRRNAGTNLREAFQ
jgi:hypothetical protein